MDARVPPVALILRGVRLNNAEGLNLLPEPVILANVLRTPTINNNDREINQGATNELRINGTGFAGAKKMDLYFDPPIFKTIGYEIISKFPLQRNEVVLRLRHGYKWREEPGPLNVIGVDTGGGPVKVNGDEGVRIAEVQADLGLHGITVEDSCESQIIYHDASVINVRGTGFNTLGTTFRFTNGLLGKGVNYTTFGLTSEAVSFRLSHGSHWRKNVESLPGFLTLLAADAGEGFVALGATNAKKGRDSRDLLFTLVILNCLLGILMNCIYLVRGSLKC